MMTHIDLIKFNSMMKAMKEHRAEAEEMLEIYGLLDACISIASFRELCLTTACRSLQGIKREVM